MNIELTETEKAQFGMMRRMMPYRAWHMVKEADKEAVLFDTSRKATNFAKKHAPCAIFNIQGV